MLSIPVLSPEQRIQQLESTVLQLISQVAGLTRELQSARADHQSLARDMDQLVPVSGQEHEQDMEELQGRLNAHDDRLDDLDGGPDEQQNDDSD
jgi:chromosome segregation ATPase